MSPCKTRTEELHATTLLATARRSPSADNTALKVSAGISSSKRQIGSHTTVPACRNADLSTMAVSLRKSPAVLPGGSYPHAVSVTSASTTGQPFRSWCSVSVTHCLSDSYNAGHCLEPLDQYAGVNPEKWTQGKPVKCKFPGLVSFELFNKANKGKIMISEKAKAVDARPVDIQAILGYVKYFLEHLEYLLLQ